MFREAKREDTKLILEFIKGLAEHEKRSDMVVATEASLEKYIFDEKIVKVIFLVKDNIECGFAMYYYKFSSFRARPILYVEDLFVLDKYRGLGYGKLLFEQLMRISVETDCVLMSWSCLITNQSSVDFYKKLNANLDDENYSYYFTNEDLKIKLNS